MALGSFSSPFSAHLPGVQTVQCIYHFIVICHHLSKSLLHVGICYTSPSFTLKQIRAFSVWCRALVFVSVVLIGGKEVKEV